MHIIDTKTGDFDPEKFEDRYEEALKDLLKKKQKGEKIERPKESRPSNVINLMDALRQSVAASGAGERRKSSARATHHRSAKGRHTRKRKAG